MRILLFCSDELVVARYCTGAEEYTEKIVTYQPTLSEFWGHKLVVKLYLPGFLMLQCNKRLEYRRTILGLTAFAYCQRYGVITDRLHTPMQLYNLPF